MTIGETYISTTQTVTVTQHSANQRTESFISVVFFFEKKKEIKKEIHIIHFLSDSAHLRTTRPTYNSASDWLGPRTAGK